MGFYYFLLLIIGVFLLVAGALWKGVTWPVKINILLFVVGIQCIIAAVIMFMPGSSDIVAGLLKWNE